VYEFKLPDLGEGIHEGEILKWHVAPGGTIQEDEPLVDVETDKAALTIPSPRGGKIVSLAGKVGDTVLVGGVLAVIDDGTGVAVAPPSAAVEAPAVKPAPSAAAAPAPVARPAGAPAAPAALGGRVIATPATRRLARAL
jgi:pyruvate/2-oxoglutarate dehydrogenase complex dihydrolipoamide acyltransferase (E2) component